MDATDSMALIVLDTDTVPSALHDATVDKDDDLRVKDRNDRAERMD